VHRAFAGICEIFVKDCLDLSGGELWVRDGFGVLRVEVRCGGVCIAVRGQGLFGFGRVVLVVCPLILRRILQVLGVQVTDRTAPALRCFGQPRGEEVKVSKCLRLCKNYKPAQSVT